ncbi:hypothetical protein KA050_00010 [Candidatus Gracilibacteria bacterium]|nr:hypothetical protein [Candidatus Gracilibacteria bacterium]
MANEKEKSPAPATKLPDGRKSPDTPLDKKPEKPKTTKEARDAARVKFEGKKGELDIARKEEADKAQASEKERQGLRTEAGKEPGVDPKVKESTDRRILSEKATLTALKEKHDLEIEEAIKSFDIDKADPETKKALHFETLKAQIDVDKLPDQTKKDALKGIKTPDGKEIDITKLTPAQKELIQDYQTRQYLQSLEKISDLEKKDPAKFRSELEKLAKENLGIVDFSTQEKLSILTEKTFIEQVKKDPDVLKDFIEQVKKDGMMLTGIDPKSELGKTLTAIVQGNIDEYRKLFPDEKDIKKMSDILGGSYLDILGDSPDDKGKSIFSGLENFSDSISGVRDAIRNGTYGEGIIPEDFLGKDGKPDEKAYQDALNKGAKMATGLTADRIKDVANKVSRGKLSPFVKFLADIFAGIGASLEQAGLLPGTFWTDYLRQNKDQNNRDNSLGGGGGGNFEQLAEVGAGDFINAAKFYLGRPYQMGGKGRKDVPGDPIDCSQLVVNSLIDTGCLPPGSDTTAMGFAGMSQKIGTNDGKEGDFLIMSEPSPHIAIITKNLGGGRYATIESASGKGGVVETERTAGQSFSVYRNPFLEGNGGIKKRGMSPDLAQMKDIMKTTSVDAKYGDSIEGAATGIKKNQARYEKVAQATGVPWELIGAIHYREASGDFNTCLHNGDPLGQKTTRVPAGRGPFNTWEEAAIDALRMKGGVGFTSMNGSDGQLRQVAAYAERYNGYGYRNRGRVSPYVWAGTPKYTGGRFIADHVYDPNSFDKRPGVMPIILSILGKNGVKPPENTPDTEKLAGNAADWFRQNDDKLYGGGEGKYDCMTSTHAALGVDYGQVGGDFNGKFIDQKDKDHNLWNVAMASALYSGCITGPNSPASGGLIQKQSNGYYGQKHDDPSNMEYHIEENIMKRTSGGRKIDVPARGKLTHYGAGYSREAIAHELDSQLSEGQSAMMGGTGEGTNKGGHEWLLVKEGGQLRVYESTKTTGSDWRGVVNGVNGKGYSLSEYLKNRESQHSSEAIIFSKK